MWRDGKTTELSVTLGERKTSQTGDQNGKDQKQKDEGLLGISVRPLTDEERRDLKIEKNEGLVIIDVNPEKPAAEADLRPGRRDSQGQPQTRSQCCGSVENRQR